MDSQKRKKPGEKILKFLVGFFIFFIILTFLNRGNVGAAAGFIILATVCTLGIGGFIIIIISYAIGSVVIDKYNPRNLENKEQTGQTFLNRKENVSSALQDYINKARGINMTAKEIEENLLKAGWSAEEIKQATNELDGLFNS